MLAISQKLEQSVAFRPINVFGATGGEMRNGSLRDAYLRRNRSLRHAAGLQPGDDALPIGARIVGSKRFVVGGHGCFSYEHP